MSRRVKKREKVSPYKYLYIDIFGHPFCTLRPEEALECEYCMVSQEYKEMIARTFCKKIIQQTKNLLTNKESRN
jgi:hypothetical protein